MQGRRVVVTGMGIISPVGNEIEPAWQNVVEGRSGIGPITEFDVSRFTTRFGGCVKDFDATEFVSQKELRKIDPFIHYGIAAACKSVDDAGITADNFPADRVGVAIGSGIGGIGTIESNCERFFEADNPRKISPFFVPGSIINMVSGHVSIRYGFTGPNLALVTACTTAAHCIGIAARTIAYGDAEVMIAGGAEYPMTPLGLGGFCAARALSTRNDDPQAASRPWDRDRDGFVLSAGAACLTLEEFESAKARGANILAEVAGFGMSGDAHHVTAPRDDGQGAAQCMTAAIRDAGLDVTDIDYVNAHGTSTPLGDKAETVGIKQVFGSHAQDVAVSSTKSTTGHLLAAAGGLESVFCILALRDSVVPPTINLDNPDPECDLDYVPHTAREMPVRAALSNSFGFGGTNGSLVFRRA
jgi:3-oxoacyl-[acyl-carrier-protein] synthase II